MYEVKDSKVSDAMMPLEVGELPQARKMELEGLEDILKMMVSINNQDMTLHHLERNGEHLYLVWIVIHDFYNLNGLPLVIFVRTDKEPTRFIKFRPESGKICFVDKIEESSAAYIKIVKIKQLPFCLDLAF